MCIRDRHNKWAEYLPFLEKAANENYSEATGYTPMELEEDKKPTRFWTKYINKPNKQNVPISVKIGYARQRIIETGNKRVERFNLTHKLQQFNVRERDVYKRQLCIL